MTEAISPSNYDWDFLRSVYANTCTETEFKVFQHLTESYNLDPVSKEIWCIKGRNNQPARIFVSRDGHLAIAHRSGVWGGMKTEYNFDGWGERIYAEIRDQYTGKVTKVLIPFSATTTIHRTDSPYPTEHTVFWDEYGSSQSLWLTKPKTMLQKVAECQCIRRAFDIHGFYAPEEMDELKEDESPVEVTSLPHSEYDLSRPSLDQKQMDKMIEDIRYDFGGQTVSSVELDCCRRPDGRYDLEAATLLKRAKYTAFKEEKVVEK